MYGNAKNGYQYKVWPEERLQKWYVLCLYLQMVSVSDARITKLKIPVRICVQLHAAFFFTLSSINLASQMVFHPIRPQHSPRVPLSNSGSWLMGQIPQFCYRKRDILVSWLLIASRFLWLYVGKENWCFWLELATSVLHRVHLVPSLQTSV